MHDLLTDALIGVLTARGEHRLSLPELLAELSAGRIDDYTSLRAHQADPWHAFLVQMAASIQARRPTETLPTDPSYWRAGLLDLSEGVDTAWHLIVEDVTKPAFLQHPWLGWATEARAFGVRTVRGQTLVDPKARTPDELDVLVTSKNHDVKMARARPNAADAWMYALVMLQTTSGFLGQGNYGIVRMNGGFASRSVIAWTQTLHPSARFGDEVSALQRLRPQVCDEFGYQSRGIVLTWLTRWDRSTHHHVITELEPWFIEAARPVRLLQAPDGSPLALGATSKVRQIGPATVDHGNVGDPWTPINVEDKKKGQSALSLSAEGFSPRRLTDLLFEQGYRLTPLQKPRPGNEAAWFVASCLVRGQGTTDGFHKIELPVPSKARAMLLSKERRDTLAHLAQGMLSDAREIQRALGTALTVLAEGGPDKPDFDRDAIKRWVERARSDFGRRWEVLYFSTLWRGADEGHETIRERWRQQLVNLAQTLVDAAATRLPIPSNRAWRAITQAQGALYSMLRKHGLPLPGRTSGEAEAREETAA